MKIEKINLVADNGEKINLENAEIEKFFLMSMINPRAPFKTLLLKLNKLKLVKILFLAYIRKFARREIGLTEEILLTAVKPVGKFRKIEFIEVNISGDKIIFNISKIHLLNLLGDLRGVVKNNQYNIGEKNMKNKIVIDAGAHNGEFSMFAVLMGAKKVYAFEPVLETANILSENVKISGMENKITVIQKALGDKDCKEKISFDFVGDGAATIGLREGKDSETIDVVKLDSFVKKNYIKKIDFIKMDVEGFEKNALLGGKEIIKKFKPILSLSAYHKKDDKVELPKTIKFLRGDYKIILNEFDEEDFYCD
jgi:FkbM family methyltransferase